MKKTPEKIFITGAAGYVGAMLADQFSKSPDILEIICIDKDPIPDFLKDNKKIFWITDNLINNGWKRLVSQKRPEVVIHCAWQIRELYNQRDLQRKLNVFSSQNLFDFCFNEPSIKRIIHFSTISSYGAFESNSLDKRFNETDRLLENEYLYGMEKREVERMLERMYLKSNRDTEVFVLRPTSITGPRGRYMVGKKGLLYFLQNVLPFFPIASDSWCRQYIHEDDVTDITAIFTFMPFPKEVRYRVYNIAPNDYVLASDMADIFGKKIVKITPNFVKIFFAIAWHVSFGKIPTSRGGWKFFSYPVPVDGSKITKEFGYNYTYTSREALSCLSGRYEEYIKK